MSRFWDELSATHKVLLEGEGFKDFRQTVARRYFTLENAENEANIFALARMLEILEIPIDIDDSTQGSPFLSDWKGRKVSQDLLNSLYELHTLEKNIDFSTVKRVTEIGAGYGRFGYALLKKHPEITYAIYDIEPALSLAERFLSSEFPGAKIEYHRIGDTFWMSDVIVAISVLSELTKKEMQDYIGNFHLAKYAYIRDFDRFKNPTDDLETGVDYYPLSAFEKILDRKDILVPGFREVLLKV